MKTLSAKIQRKCPLFSALSDKIIDCVVNEYQSNIQNCWGQYHDEPGNMVGEVFLCFVSNSSTKFPSYMYLSDTSVENTLHSFGGN